LTDDNGSSSSSIEEDFDEEEEEAYQIRRDISATHIAVHHLAKDREDVATRLRTVASQERLPTAMQRMIPSLTKSQSSAGYSQQPLAMQAPPQATIRNSRSSSNLLSRMLSSAH
jgi:hypothetical protein